MTTLSLKTFARLPARIDRVWLTTGLLLAALTLAAPDKAANGVQFMLTNLADIAPFLILAVVVAGYCRATGADGLIANAFAGRRAVAIIIAALFGALSPFCSCGVIPLIAALLAMGVPLPAVMAFWLASPVMDPSMFVLTVGALGLPFAIAKTLAAIGLGLLGGAVTVGLQTAGGLTDPLRPGVGDGGCGGGAVRRPANVVWPFWREDPRRQTFVREATASALFLLKWLALAFLLESLMLAYVPAESIATALGTGSPWAIPLAAVVGVPAYLNGYAALPLVAGLMELGTAPGAGLTFLVAGGVTSIPAAMAVFALVRRPVFVLYLILSLSGAMMAGGLFQLYAA